MGESIGKRKIGTGKKGGGRAVAKAAMIGLPANASQIFAASGREFSLDLPFGYGSVPWYFRSIMALTASGRFGFDRDLPCYEEPDASDLTILRSSLAKNQTSFKLDELRAAWNHAINVFETIFEGLSLSGARATALEFQSKPPSFLMRHRWPQPVLWPLHWLPNLILLFEDPNSGSVSPQSLSAFYFDVQNLKRVAQRLRPLGKLPLPGYLSLAASRYTTVCAWGGGVPANGLSDVELGLGLWILRTASRVHDEINSQLLPIGIGLCAQCGRLRVRHLAYCSEACRLSDKSARSRRGLPPSKKKTPVPVKVSRA